MRMGFRTVALASIAVCLPAQQPREQGAWPTLADVTAASKIDFRNDSSKTSRKYLIESMVAGVAMLDYDRDGFQDLYFANSAALKDPMPAGSMPDKSHARFWNRLYRNYGDGTFTDVTCQAGVQDSYHGMGAVAGDYANDGWPGIYVTNFGRNTLHRNNRDGTFADVTAKAGVGRSGWPSSTLEAKSARLCCVHRRTFWRDVRSH